MKTMKKLIIIASIILFSTTINAQQVYVKIVDTVEAITENCESIMYTGQPPIIDTKCDTIGYDSVKTYKFYYLELKYYPLEVKGVNNGDTIYKHRPYRYYYDTIYMK